ncbi:MAG: IS607 family element RNA-guided endonuclease TnpB [Acidimicrobiales bacterium]
MLVEMRTSAQAQRVAEATGCRRLPGNEQASLSRKVDVGCDLEAHRSAVEAVSVLFKVWDEGNQVSSGWTITAAKFEVEWPKDPSVIRSHFGARRKAYNWALGQVKADLSAKAANPAHESMAWTLPALRQRWNDEKAEVAPWWAENSKECYSSGISDLVEALNNWSESKKGQRKGAKVGFPRFKSARRGDPGRVRFTTGAMRLEDDRRTITLPVIGALRSKENTRGVQRFLSRGDARILNVTLSERWGRLFVSLNYALRTFAPRPVAKPGVRAGVDLGLRTLATVVDTEGNIIEFPNPAPLRASLSERRKVGRQMSRRIPGSLGHGRAKAKLARLDRCVVHIRQDSWHKLTTELVSTYGEVVIEDLDLAAMKRSMGRRAFRRSVSDASLGAFAPMLGYKTARSGGRILKADRWFASSQIHHGCGCRLIAPTRMARQLICEVTGEVVDRDINAAKNLRDWPETQASSGPVGPSAPVDTRATSDGGTDPGSDRGMTLGPRSDRKTRPQGKARRCEARTEPEDSQARNLERGAA